MYLTTQISFKDQESNKQKGTFQISTLKCTCDMGGRHEPRSIHYELGDPDFTSPV